MKRVVLLLATLLISAQGWGAINRTPIQCIRVDDTGTGETIAGAEGWVTPAAGELLSSLIVVDNSNQDATGDISPPAGFTEMFEYETASGNRTNWNFSLKVAVGDESSVSVLLGQDLGDFAWLLCRHDPTELDLSDLADIALNGASQDTTNAATQVQGTSSLVNPVAASLMLYPFGLDTDNLWSGAFVQGTSTLEVGVAEDPLAGALLAIEVVSSSASQSEALETLDPGSQALGGVVAIPGLPPAPTASLDDATPEAGGTVRVTASSAPGGVLTTATLVIGGATKSLSCEPGATSTICDVAFPLAAFAPAGALDTIQVEIAGTIKVSDGVNETQTTPITIVTPANGKSVLLTCDPDIVDDCDPGSEAVPGQNVGDRLMVVQLSGAAIVDLTTDGQPILDGPTGVGDYLVLPWGQTVWLEQNTVNVSDELPVLSAPIASNAVAGGTLDCTVTTDRAGGTLYWNVDLLRTSNCYAVKIKSALAGGGTAVPVVGANLISGIAVAPGRYYCHFCQEDASGNDSNQVSSGQLLVPNSGTDVDADYRNVAPAVMRDVPDLAKVNGQAEEFSIAWGMRGCEADAQFNPVYSATGLPGGASVDPDTGLVDVPDWGTDVTHNVVITCNNDIGPAANDSFTVTVGTPP